MRIGAAVLILLIVAIAAAPAAAPSRSTRENDVRLLGQRLAELHPDPFRAVTRTRFRAAVEALRARASRLSSNELLVELMRVAALLGPRNGHTGIFPGDPQHVRRLHLYPLRLYEFSDGIFVVDDRGEHDLVGARLVSIGGVDVESVLRRVRPLVPRDNVSSLRGLAPHFALTAEVLDGLGIVDGIGSARFGLVRQRGARVDVDLAPLPANEYVTIFADPLHGHYPAALPPGPRPLFRANAGRELWLTRLARGRAIYVGYNSAQASVYEVAMRLRRLASRADVRRVIVDIRQNGGGDNTTYGPLIAALASPQVNRRGRLYVLIGRATFSAAGYFAAELDRETSAIFLGEATGGGVDQYGDSTTFSLPTLGWNVYVARVYTERERPDDRRLAIEPDVRVALSSTDFLAGRDPVLAAAPRGMS
jgi:Peptidase family S41